MADLVTLVVDKYDGSLKAEHGTGIRLGRRSSATSRAIRPRT